MPNVAFFLYEILYENFHSSIDTLIFIVIECQLTKILIGGVYGKESG